MRQHVFNAQLSRRQVLQIGAAAGIVAMFGRMPSAFASDDLAHLRRSTYEPLVGSTFTVAGAALVLAAVPGTEETFRLEFTGAEGAVDEGINRFSEPSLGSFDLFVAPVGDGADGTYEVVVDRSVKLAGDVPGPPATAPAAPAAAAPAAAAPAAAAPAAAAAAASLAAPARAAGKKKKAPAKHKKPVAKKKRPKRRVLRRRKRRHAKTAS